MALLTAAPTNLRIGQQVTVVGVDFANTTECTMACDAVGMAAEIASDSTGQLSGAALADHAKTTLTSAGVFANDETLTIGTRVFTLKTTLTGAANEVLLGANASACLDNLKSAINGTAGAGSTYGRGTASHADVVAGAKTATTLVLISKLEGTGGNAIVSTETCTNASFTGGVFTGGAAAAARAFRFSPPKEGTYVVSCTDGTNTASVPVQVWASA